jgi:hypothetical protein
MAHTRASPMTQAHAHCPSCTCTLKLRHVQQTGQVSSCVNQRQTMTSSRHIGNRLSLRDSEAASPIDATEVTNEQRDHPQPFTGRRGRETYLAQERNATVLTDFAILRYVWT